jgi:hypothetical protein
MHYVILSVIGYVIYSISIYIPSPHYTYAPPLYMVLSRLIYKIPRMPKCSQGGRKWSANYKKTIRCNKPKGFSQRQYCKLGGTADSFGTPK